MEEKRVVCIAHKVMALIIGFILGIVLGSGVKALADRSLGKKSFGGRSYCPMCKHKLAWYDLFPIFSYILLGGKCRYCHKKIGIEYVLVEIGMGILVGFLFWQAFQNSQFSILNFQLILNVDNFKILIFSLELIFKTFFIVILAILFLTDIKKMFIPDRIILPSIIIGIVLSVVITAVKIIYLYFTLIQTPLGRLLLPPKNEYFLRHVLIIATPLFYSLLTGALIGGFFLSLIIVTRGKGMGGGDVKLGAFMGIMLGFPGAVFALILSFLTGAVFSIGLIISGKKHFGQTIPFGPFLVLGSLIMLFWGSQIIDWYFQLGR
ncbi:prepilin peptidase [Patescibacteria group bacterium]|nr:prepilin peptidase [Patescibacteria group bacterium]